MRFSASLGADGRVRVRVRVRVRIRARVSARVGCRGLGHLGADG